MKKKSEDIKVFVGGVQLEGLTQISYDDKGNKSITNMSVEQFEDRVEQNITFSSKKEMLTALYRYGFELMFGGSSDRPVSYRLPDNGVKPAHIEDFEAFLTTVTLKEWKEAQDES